MKSDDQAVLFAPGVPSYAAPRVYGFVTSPSQLIDTLMSGVRNTMARTSPGDTATPNELTSIEKKAKELWAAAGPGKDPYARVAVSLWIGTPSMVRRISQSTGTLASDD